MSRIKQWVLQSGQQWIEGDTGFRDPLEILCELERRQDIIEMLGELVDTKKDNGDAVLSPRDIRVLYMYIKGSPSNIIESKTNIGDGHAARKVSQIAGKILRHFPVFRWYHLAVPKESILEADVPEVKIGWALASAKNAYKESKWGTEYRRKAWKTKTHCLVPEFFQVTFGDNDTKCTLCSVHQCTRRNAQ